MHVAQKHGIEIVAIEEDFIPKAATPDVTCKDTSDATSTAAEAGVNDEMCIRDRDIREENYIQKSEDNLIRIAKDSKYKIKNLKRSIIGLALLSLIHI